MSFVPETAANKLVAPATCPVGVIIPVYNRATIILATLESVARQTVKPARLIVVDDGSTDDTPAAVEAWISTAHPPFEARFIRRPHESAAAARNAGLAAIDDLPLVAFLDSDDCWPDDFLARTSAALAADRDAVAATVDRQFRNAAGIVIHFDDCRALVADPISWFFGNGAGIASSTLLRTAVIHAVGGWEATLQSAEDSMLFSLVALEGRWVHAPGAPVEFHHGNATACREEGNLSSRYADAYRRWAGVYEQIFEAIDGRYPHRLHDRLRGAVAGYWYRAGKQLAGLGRPGEAQDCFARAVRWKPTMWRAWQRRILAAALGRS